MYTRLLKALVQNVKAGNNYMLDLLLTYKNLNAFFQKV